MLYKTTTQLFKGMYQYKVVLICASAGWFRGNDFDTALDRLKKVNLESPNTNYLGGRHIKTQDQLDYAFKLQNQLSLLKDIEVRVEDPWISVYTNNVDNITSLVNLDIDNVKYVCKPADNVSLSSDIIVMPKMPYDYRVTLSKTTQENTAFIQWASTNKNVKLTKSCIKDLSKPRSWGGTHFYVSGDNNLLMSKMHLGATISKVQRIIKA
jgi:hypothetical protein